MSVVMKFGGTSVADAAAFENVARIVANERDAAPIVVVSAMSGVTDSLLAATNIASLENVFERHRAVARELLDSSQAATFIDQLREAADQIAALLAQKPAECKSLQDAIVSFGETLSSTLLAAVLNQKGIKARQVDARRCIVTDEEFTSAVPLMA
jgi:aspartate kinase